MRVLNKTRDSFAEISKSPLVIKGLLIILFFSILIRTFVYVTTNRLYNPIISELLRPFYLYILILATTLGLILLAYYAFNRKLTDFLIISSFSILFISFLLSIYGFSPCLVRHTSSYTEHIHPHPISYILKQSFLCPSYSHNSRFHLMFLSVISFLIFIICIAEKRIKKEV